MTIAALPSKLSIALATLVDTDWTRPGAVEPPAEFGFCRLPSSSARPPTQAARRALSCHDTNVISAQQGATDPRHRGATTIAPVATVATVAPRVAIRYNGEHWW